MQLKMQRSANRLVLALSVLLLTPMLLPAQTVDIRRPKKFIETGGDQPDTKTLREKLAVMEQQPFDGVVINVVGRKPDGTVPNFRDAFCNDVWQREWFQNCIDDLKACHFTRFTDNFFVLGANPGNVDWFDDAGWKNIVEHWRIAAWLAKQAGVKGLLFDPEAYAEPVAQFRYSSQPQAAQHTFNEYWQKARQRGREVMEAIASEYPDMTLFCYFMESVNAPATGCTAPEEALAERLNALYSPFIDGWLDAIPPKLTLVDGCEMAYLYNSQRQYLEACMRMKGHCQDLVSPENRLKYRAQVQTSFGIYLDAYWNAKDSKHGNWYIDGLGGSRVARLQANILSAIGAADEYVWIYGEKACWWPTPAKMKPWTEVLPGCDGILRLARDPQAEGRRRLAEARQAGTLKNLLVNGDFSAETVALPEGGEEKYAEGGPPAGWKNWPQADKKGSYVWDREQKAAKLANVRDGGFRQIVAVEPEQLYAVRGAIRKQGHGNALLRIRYQNAKGEWLDKDQERFLCPTVPVSDGKETFRVLQVPENATKLVVLLWARDQKSAEDVAWFDGLEVYRIP